MGDEWDKGGLFVVADAADAGRARGGAAGEDDTWAGAADATPAANGGAVGTEET